MFKKLFSIGMALIIACVLLSPGGSIVQAQMPKQPVPPSPHAPWAFPPGWLGPTPGRGNLELNKARLGQKTEVVSPQATGGPDGFGYTWDDSLPFSWIDASSGNDTGLTSYCEYTTAVPLGFDFKFYENTYSTAYVSYNGFLSMDEVDGCWVSDVIPNQYGPTNLIAPYLGWFADNSTGHVRYLQGGTAPDRYTVIEWNQMTDFNGDATYTFEAILFESGDILFQFQDMNYGSSWSSAGTGIDDFVGLDGLNYQFGSQINNNTAVYFYRPGPLARVQIWPRHYGSFTAASELASFQLPVHNTGELGPDTYDMVPSSTWTVSFFDSDGVTPLVDSDSDGNLETPPIPQGETRNIFAKVETPAGAVLGDSNVATITIISSLNLAKSKIVILKTAVPAPFAQAYIDNAEDNPISLYLANPAGSTRHAIPDTWGSDVAVAAAPNGNFIYAWWNDRCLDDDCNLYVREIQYTLFDHNGQMLLPVKTLEDLSGVTMSTYEWAPTVAVTPDGNIGITWGHFIWDYNGSLNSNIYFAVLDPQGNLIRGPLNLTNNSEWDSGSSLKTPFIFDPHIAATLDNHFVLNWAFWELRKVKGNIILISDIYYTVRESSGAKGSAIKLLTKGKSAKEFSFSPNLTAAGSNNVLMTYEHDDGDIYFAVVNSKGRKVMDITNLSNDGWDHYDLRSDAVQLQDGSYAVAWWSDLNISYAILDSSFHLLSGPTMLDNPDAIEGNESPCVTGDQYGHAIITWMDLESDYNRHYLYYALINNDGTVLTEPMIFRSSTEYLETSFIGVGNTNNVIAP